MGLVITAGRRVEDGWRVASWQMACLWTRVGAQSLAASVRVPLCNVPLSATHPTPGTLAPLVGVIAAVCTSNAVAVLCGTEGVYESELEASLGLNYLSQVG